MGICVKVTAVVVLNYMITFKAVFYAFYLEFFLNVGHGGKLIAELQSCQHRVLIGQREVSWTGKAFIGVDA